MKSLLKILIIFLAITGATSLLIQYTNLEFGRTNFFDLRTIWFLVFVTIFPRLTLLFSSVAFGGILWWIGFFIAPRLLVALLATKAYWMTNPVLVMIAWLVAIGGESGEKFIISRNSFFRFRKPKINIRFQSSRGGPGFGSKPQPHPSEPSHNQTFEAEYKIKD